MPSACMYLGLPFQGAVVQGANMLYVYIPLEDMLQNKAVDMAFSVDTKYRHIQGKTNVIRKLDSHSGTLYNIHRWEPKFCLL